MLLSAILVFVGVLLIAATLEHALNHGFETDEDGGEMPSYLSRTGESGWIKSVSLALVAGLARYAAVAAGWSAVAAIILMTAAMIGIAIWWWRDGDRFGEFLLFLLLSIIADFILRAACAKIVEEGFVKTPFWASVWTVAYPRILALCVTGFMLVSLLQRSYGRTGKRWQYLLAWILLVLYILSILACLIFGVNWKSLKKQEQRVIPTATATPAATPTTTATPMATPTATPVANWYFYNTECLADEDPSNDFNFGPNPLETILQRKIDSGDLKLEKQDWLYEVMSGVGSEKPFDARLLETATKNAGKGASKNRIAELVQQYKLRIFEIVAAEEVDRELRNRLPNDPALGPAVMAWADVVLGSRYLGVFHDEVEDEWDAAMNKAKVRWMEYPADYNRTLAAFFTLLDQAKVEIVAVSGGLNDQMYMNPYTSDHIPDIIVRETTDTEGLFLRYTIDIKGQAYELAYRIDCGFQPVNVAKLMKITPQKPVPTPTPTAKPTEPPPTATPTAKPTDPPPTATPEATPEPTGKPSGGDPDPTPTGKPSGGDPDPTPTGKPSGGDPDPTPTAKPTEPPPTPTAKPTEPPPTPTQEPKDPTKGTDVGGNDNMEDPGPDTNTGVGGQYSSEDLPTNTSAEDDYNDYAEWLETIRRGEEQRRGGDSNEPSTEPPKESPPPSGGGNNDPPPKESPPPSSGGNDDPPPSESPTVQMNEGIDEIPDVEPGVEVDSDLGGTSSTDDDPDGTGWDGPPD